MLDSLLTLCSADLLGAIEYLNPPFFSKMNRLTSLPPMKPYESEERATLKDLLDTLSISPNLVSCLMHMHSIAEEISSALFGPVIYTQSEQLVLLEYTYALRYELLSPSCLEFGSQVVDEVLKIGALLFITATPQEVPFATLGPGSIVKRFRELVLSVQMWNEREGVLVMWLLFIGAMCARKGEDRVWFVAQIEKLTAKLAFREWKDVREKLEGLWWVSGVHEKAAREIWVEVGVMKKVVRSKRDLFKDRT